MNRRESGEIFSGQSTRDNLSERAFICHLYGIVKLVFLFRK